MLHPANSFYHIVWGLVVFALGAQFFHFLSEIEGDALTPLAAIIGHLAWPSVALLVAFWVLRELQNDLVSRLFPHGGTVKVAGIELDIQRAEEALEEEGVEPAPEMVEVASGAQKTEQVTPYEMVMQSWREVAEVLTEQGTSKGGPNDLRKVASNISLLESTGDLPEKIASAARALFTARNSFRRLPADQVTLKVAVDYAIAANTLYAYLKAERTS